MDEPEQLLEHRLRGFKAALTEYQLEKFPSTSLRDVKHFIMVLQRDQEEKKSLMNFSRLHSFLEAMTQFVDVCGAMNMGQPELSCFIWGPSMFILRLANELPSALDATLDYYFEFGRKMPLLVPHRTLIQTCSPMKQLLAQMYVDLLDFHSRMLKLFAERNWKRTFSANSENYRKLFDESLTRVECHRKLLDDVIQQEGSMYIDDTAQRLNDHIQRYESDQNSIQLLLRAYEEDRQKRQEDIEKQEKKRKDQMLSVVMRWLSDEVDEQVDYRRFSKVRSEFPGTGSWILQDKKVKDWVESNTPSSSLLWIRGKMAAGKTILASHMIDHLTQISGSKTSYYYCSGNKAKGANCLSLYKSLSRQFLTHNEEALLPVFHQRKLRDKEILLDEGQAKKLVELGCEMNLQQYIIIDGLDEFSDQERQQAMRALVDIVEKNDHMPGKIRVLFMSQDLRDMKNELSTAEILDLPAKAVQADIEVFIDMRLEELKQNWGLTDTETRRARFLISKGANGVFLYAVLVLKNLFEQLTKECVLLELQESNIPGNLKDVYEKIIQRLKNKHGTAWTTARKVFSWLACAKRPLAWHELQAALSIFTRKDNLEPFFSIDLGQLRRDIREVCGPLIYVVEGERIDFVHQTARRFILEGEAIDVRTVECDLAVLCLNYLSLSCFDASTSDTQVTELANQGYFAFQDYAVSKWAEHFESLISEKNSTLFEDPVKGSSYRRKGAHALQNFYKVHGKDVTAAGMQDQSLTLASSVPTPEMQCQPFKSYDFYDQLVGVWTCIRRHQSKPSKERDKTNITSLENALKRSRKELEELFENASTPTEVALLDKLETLYGSRIYKCNHLRCQYFYQGFETQEIRDNHLNRHDRPFQCSVEGCSLIPFGFPTNKDLEKHLRNYHPDPAHAGFRPLDLDRPEKGRFTCEECQKSFTRYANLEGHKNSHSGQRPYACTLCGRGFARANDRRRHEKTHRRR